MSKCETRSDDSSFDPGDLNLAPDREVATETLSSILSPAQPKAFPAFKFLTYALASGRSPPRQ